MSLKDYSNNITLPYGLGICCENMNYPDGSLLCTGLKSKNENAVCLSVF